MVEQCKGEKIGYTEQYHGAVSKRLTGEEVKATNGKHSVVTNWKFGQLGEQPVEISEQNFHVGARTTVNVPGGKATIQKDTQVHFTSALPIKDAQGSPAEKFAASPVKFVNVGNIKSGMVSFGMGENGQLQAQVDGGAVIENPAKVAAALKKAGVVVTPDKASPKPLSVDMLYAAAKGVYCPTR